MKLDGLWVLTVMKSPLPAGWICHQYSSVVTAIIPYSRTIKLQHTLLGDYWECVRPARLPVLTWVPSFVPTGKNIQDTFLIGFATDTTARYTTYIKILRRQLSVLLFVVLEMHTCWFVKQLVANNETTVEVDGFIHSENNHQTGKQTRNGEKDNTLQIREFYR